MPKNTEVTKRLQLAALELIELIEQNIQEDAPEGIFRISMSASKLKVQLEGIQTGRANIFHELNQIERAALLKAVLRTLKEEGNALLSYQKFELLQAAQIKQDTMANCLQDTVYINQLIAFNLFRLLCKTEAMKYSSNMSATSLAVVIGPNLFDMTSEQEIQSLASVNSITEGLIRSADSINPPQKTLESTHYQYLTNEPGKGRFHAASVDGKQYTGLSNELQLLKGDHLKSQILLKFKAEIEKADSPETLDNIEKALRGSKEFEVLKSGQGVTTKLFKQLKTSSVKAFEQMIEEQKDNLQIEGQHSHSNK